MPYRAVPCRAVPCRAIPRNNPGFADKGDADADSHDEDSAHDHDGISHTHMVHVTQAAEVEGQYLKSEKSLLLRICSRGLIWVASSSRRSLRSGGTKQPNNQRPLGAVACCSMLLLTHALLMTSLHSKDQGF